MPAHSNVLLLLSFVLALAILRFGGRPRFHPTGVSRRHSPFGQCPIAGSENGTPAATQKRERAETIPQSFFPSLPNDDAAGYGDSYYVARRRHSSLHGWFKSPCEPERERASDDALQGCRKCACLSPFYPSRIGQL